MLSFRFRYILRISILLFGAYTSICITRQLYISILLQFEGLFFSPFALSYRYDWMSPYSGWYNRSVPLNDTSQIHFDRADLRIIATSSAWGTMSLNVAMFAPDLCITRTSVLRMNQTDFEGIAHLTKQAVKIKRTWYNMRPRFHDIATSKLRLVGEGDQERTYSVYGFHKHGADKGANTLPPVLWELFGLVAPDEIEGWKTTGGEELTRLLEEVTELGTDSR